LRFLLGGAITSPLVCENDIRKNKEMQGKKVTGFRIVRPAFLGVLPREETGLWREFLHTRDAEDSTAHMTFYKGGEG